MPWWCYGDMYGDMYGDYVCDIYENYLRSAWWCYGDMYGDMYGDCVCDIYENYLRSALVVILIDITYIITIHITREHLAFTAKQHQC